MLLYRLHCIARRLLPLRSYCMLLAVVGVVLTGFALLTTRHYAERFLSIAVLLTLWSLMLFAFIQLFQHIPAPVLPLDKPLERLRGRIKLWLFKLLAVIVAALGLTLVSMSIKLLLIRQNGA